MEDTLSPGGPVDSEHAEAEWGQCRRCHTKVNCTNRDNWSQEQLQVILHHPVQGDGEYAADPAYGKSMGYRLLIYVSRRWNVRRKLPKDSEQIYHSFDTEKLNGKHREIFAPLSFVPDKEDFSYIWAQFQFIRQHPWLDRGQTWL